MSAALLAEVILYLILLAPVALVVFDSLCRLVFLLVASLPRGQADSGNEDNGLKLLLLVVAHDEERVLEQTLERLKEQADDSAQIAVLADHCSDATASIAARMGALVYARNEGCAGKSEALSWLAREADLLSSSDIMVVLDADSLVEAGFCQQIRAAFRPGVEAVQSFVNPVSCNGFPLTTLVSLSEILSERIDDAARSRLGWSVPLRGTGMALWASTFLSACQGLETQVDDIELSVRLAELGITVRFAPCAIVSDPKSDRALGLARQRGRWLKGQRQIWRTKRRSIASLLRSGLPNWSLIQALLLKPKTALMAMRAGMMVALWAWPLPHALLHDVLLGGVAASLLIETLYYVSGLRFTSHAGKYLLSLLSSPALLFLWAVGWGYSLLPTQEWLRTEEK